MKKKKSHKKVHRTLSQKIARAKAKVKRLEKYQRARKHNR